MLYLVFVLTFLTGILFYALSPRDDQVNLDVYRAEGFIASFLAQHQAAKDYMAQWLGFCLDPTAGVCLHHLTDAGSNFFSLTQGNFTPFFPRGVTVEMSACQNDATQPVAVCTHQRINSNVDWHYQTTVFCYKDDLPNPPLITSCNDPDVKGRYLVTYSGVADDACGGNRPDWWPSLESSRQRRYGAWRNAINRRTHGSYNCGTLTYVSDLDQWCVDNGQMVKLPSGRCAQEVPKAIARQLGCAGAPSPTACCWDALICISRLKQGPEEYYVEGLRAFYDGINNKNTGAEGPRGGNVWVDMINGVENAKNDDLITDAGPPGGDVYYSGRYPDVIKFPNFRIVNDTDGIFHNFTLTVLIATTAEGEYEIDFDLDHEGNVQMKFKKELASNGNLNLLLNGTSYASVELPLTQNIQSVTFVGDSAKVSVYVNSVRKTTIPVSAATPPPAGHAPSTHWAYSFGAAYLHFKIAPISGEFKIYGVRYYADKALDASEIKKNFDTDSKRYGIGIGN